MSAFKERIFEIEPMFVAGRYTALEFEDFYLCKGIPESKDPSDLPSSSSVLDCLK